MNQKLDTLFILLCVHIYKVNLTPLLLHFFTTLTYLSFLACNTVQTSVYVHNDFRPFARILGDANRVIDRKQELPLFAEAYLPSCSSRQLNSGFSYSWKVSHGSVLLIEPELTSKFSSFIIKPYSLEPNKVYDITLTVTGKSQRAVINTISVTVTSSITADVKGGNRFSMYPSTSLLLDASSNNDNLDINEILTFKWTCIRSFPLGDCSGITLEYFRDRFNRPVPSILAVNTGDEYVCQPGTVIITLAVTSNLVAETSYNEIYITIVNVDTPIIRSLSATTGRSKFNINENIVLEGIVGIPINATVSWSSLNINLRTISITPVSTFMLRSTASIQNLIIKPYSLPEGSKLTFTLTAKSATKSVSSSIEIVTNTPPTNGILNVHPKIGIELNDEFTLSSYFWADEDIPLSYDFLYSFDTTSSTFTLKSRSEANIAVVYLTANSMYYKSKINVTVVGNVYDSFDAFSSSSVPVTVLPWKFTSREFDSRITLELSDLKSRADPTNTDGISQLASILNRVDCTSSPNCTLLNRNSCIYTPNTCGKCINGFFGDEADSNTLCTSNILKSPKRCPNDCNNKGICIYISIKSNKNIESCSTADPTCYAECQCNSGFGSINCNKTTNELQKASEYRVSMINIIENAVITTESVKPQAVNGWINNLAELGINFLTINTL